MSHTQRSRDGHRGSVENSFFETLGVVVGPVCGQSVSVVGPRVSCSGRIGVSARFCSLCGIAGVGIGWFRSCFGGGRRYVDVEVGMMAAGVAPGLSADAVSFQGARSSGQRPVYEEGGWMWPCVDGL